MASRALGRPYDRRCAWNDLNRLQLHVLFADGFQVVLAEEPSENSVGFVVAMSPEPGVRADKGTTVTIYVGVNPDNASANTTEGSEG